MERKLGRRYHWAPDQRCWGPGVRAAMASVCVWGGGWRGTELISKGFNVRLKKESAEGLCH